VDYFGGLCGVGCLLYILFMFLAAIPVQKGSNNICLLLLEYSLLNKWDHVFKTLIFLIFFGISCETSPVFFSIMLLSQKIETTPTLLQILSSLLALFFQITCALDSAIVIFFLEIAGAAGAVWGASEVKLLVHFTTTLIHSLSR